MSARAAAFLLGITCALHGAAEGAEYDAGRFVVHYAAVPTEQLAPSAAAAYGIVRHPERALFTVVVIRKASGAPGAAIPAQVLVSAANQEGRYRPVVLRRVDEPPSITYLGEFSVADRETLSFELSVLPEGEAAPVRLRLQQQFFTR